MKVYFVTPTPISLLDLTVMGGSEKAGDETKIGQFASGLKYAMALMLRNKIQFKVSTKNEKVGWVSYVLDSCNITEGKTKEVVALEDLGSGIKHATGFSVEMGLGWSCWMVLRELFSNMKDEGGYYQEDFLKNPPTNGTIMELEFESDSDFYEVWQNKHLYINEQEPLFKISDSLDAYDNPSKHLRIFKQGILVYEDRSKYSEWAWGIKFGEIDERRLLNNVSGIINQIADEIKYTTNQDFCDALVKDFGWINEKDFLDAVCCYGLLGSTLLHTVYDRYREFGEVVTYGWIYQKALEAPQSILPGRIIRSVNDHIWNYAKDVKIEDSKEVLESKSDSPSIKADIEFHYKIKIDCGVKETTLSGAEAIADKFNNCILVSNDFDTTNKEHIASFLIQYIDLTQKGNLLKNTALALAEALIK